MTGIDALRAPGPICTMPTTPIGSLCEAISPLFTVSYRANGATERCHRCQVHLLPTIIYLTTEEGLTLEGVVRLSPLQGKPA